ncbi:hypothetical protein HDE_02574 [Halotydeus destructor]|nr:hypothetical protein HDE_02574 [Halotydeus destructor]
MKQRVLTIQLIAFFVGVICLPLIRNAEVEHLNLETLSSSDYVSDILQDSLKYVQAECRHSIEGLVQAIQRNESWAQSFGQSWFKLHHSISNDLSSDFGDFDKCIAIRHDAENYQGKYCLAQFTGTKGKESKTQRLGFCVPSTCTDDEISAYLGKRILEHNVTIYGECQTSLQDIDEDITVITAQCVLGAYLSCIVLATILCHTNCGPKWLSWFDLIANFKSAFAGQKNQSPVRRTAILDAIKFNMVVSSMWLHTLIFGIFSRISLPNQFPPSDGLFYTSPFMNGSMVMCIQFIMSGFLAYFTLQSTLKRCEGRLPILRLILRKWLRIAPISLFTSLSVLSVSVKFASGPLWPSYLRYVQDNCKRNFLLDFLGLGSFMTGVSDMCAPTNWAMATDFQLYIIFLPLMGLLYRNPRAGFTVFALLSGTALAIVGLMTYYLPLPAFFFMTDMNMELFHATSQWTHTNPLCYLASYAIGITMAHFITQGYMVTKFKYNFTGWFISMVPLCILLAVQNRVFPVGTSGSPLYDAIYASAFRLVFPASAAWVYYRLITGDSDASKFFSWPGFSFAGTMYTPLFWGQTFALYFMMATLSQQANMTTFPVYFEALSVAFSASYSQSFSTSLPIDHFTILKLKSVWKALKSNCD